MIKLLILFLIFILQPVELFSQIKEPDKILERVKNQFEKIEDYEVDVHLKIDVRFLKVPETDAKLYFKQPDKIHVESDRFAMLPREGFAFSPMALIEGEYTALYEGEDTLQNIQVSVVKVIPLGNESNIVLSTFWIDQNRNLIMKMESSRKPSGTFSLEFKYDVFEDNYELPLAMVFTFTMDKMVLPRGMDNNMDTSLDGESKKESEQITGNVYMTYSNYKVNNNLPDELFENKKSEKK